MAETSGAAANAAEEKGCMASIMDAISVFFMAIFEAIFFIVKKLYELLMLIVACFEFIWYPIKERTKACCRWCDRKSNRS